jgi:hypothetical protein
VSTLCFGGSSPESVPVCGSTLQEVTGSQDSESGESPRPVREELQGMRLRGGAKDKSGWSVRVSGVTVCAGCIGCQGPVGRTGTDGERRGERGVGSGLGCVSGCSQRWSASVGLASACVLCPYFTCRCPGQDLMNVS